MSVLGLPSVDCNIRRSCSGRYCRLQYSRRRCRTWFGIVLTLLLLVRLVVGLRALVGREGTTRTKVFIIVRYCRRTHLYAFVFGVTLAGMLSAFSKEENQNNLAKTTILGLFQTLFVARHQMMNWSSQGMRTTIWRFLNLSGTHRVGTICFPP